MCFLYQRDSAIDVCCSPLIQTEDVFRVEPLLTPPPLISDTFLLKGQMRKEAKTHRITLIPVVPAHGGNSIVSSDRCIPQCDWDRDV